MAREKADPHQDWLAWAAGLTAAGRAALTKKSTAAPSGNYTNEARESFREFHDELTPETARQLDALVPLAPAEEDDLGARRYCLVVCRDGELPMLQTFGDAADLARRVGDLEGHDVAVWAVHGVRLPISRGPQRYLMLPDQETALTVPTYKGGPLRRVDVALLSGIYTQDDGYLGPPELVEPEIVARRLFTATTPTRPGGGGDADDDAAEAVID